MLIVVDKFIKTFNKKLLTNSHSCCLYILIKKQKYLAENYHNNLHTLLNTKIRKIRKKLLTLHIVHIVLIVIIIKYQSVV